MRKFGESLGLNVNNRFSVSRCCCCEFVGLWACHNGTTQRIDGGSLYSWVAGCSTGSPGCQPGTAGDACFAAGETQYVWVKAISYTISGSSICWLIDTATTCTSGGLPVIPVSFTRITVCVSCDVAASPTVDTQIPMRITLGCLLDLPKIPISYSQNSGMTCSC